MQQSVAGVSPVQRSVKVRRDVLHVMHGAARDTWLVSRDKLGLCFEQAEYVRIILAVMRRLAPAARVLVIGLGGGIMCALFSCCGLRPSQRCACCTLQPLIFARN